LGVYTRPDSPFHWMLLERPHQRPYRESTGIPKDGGSPEQNKELRRQAQAIYAARMTEFARLRFKLPTTLTRRTFAEQRVWYAEHVSTTKRGTVKELSMLRQLGKYFDPIDLAQIDQACAREWRTWRLGTVSAATVRREEEILKHLLTTSVPKYLDASPLAKLPHLRVVGLDTRIFSPDEERRLLKKARTTEDRALLICALDTLLRLSNARQLTRKQDHGTYLFSDTKTDAIRIPVSARLRKALDGLPMAGASYFPTYARASNTPAIAMFMETCDRAKVQTGRKTGGVSFHCLRHTGASRMLAKGHDVKTVMRIGGWKNLKVLERYLHPTDAAAQAAVDSIGAASKSRRAAIT
jgi:integrase